MRVLCYIYENMADFEVTLLLHRLHQAGCQVKTVGDAANRVTAQSGMHYVPDLTLEDAAEQTLPDALLIPGGPINPQQNGICPLIQRMDAAKRLVAAICFAPQFLARAGVLEKHSFATSCSHAKMAQLGIPDFFPRAWEQDARVVKDGHILTAKGYAFVDFAEAVCRELQVADEETLHGWFEPIRGENAGMRVRDYQRLAMTTLNPELSPKEVLMNGVMGLCGESGEVIDLVKKHLFQGHPLDGTALMKELGDVAWYLAECAEGLGVKLEDILRGNVDKLRRRYPAGFSTEKSMERQENPDERLEG